MSNPTPVAPMDSSQKNSQMVGPVEEEATVMMNAANSTCHWNGAAFDDGASVCDNGTAYECSLGKWVKQDDGC